MKPAARKPLFRLLRPRRAAGRARPQTPPVAPTEAECHQIAAMPDPVLRNLRITWTYHRFAVALTRHLGQRDATWPAFACWASRVAGRFIRLDELAAENAEQVGFGNLKVFAELGPIFARTLGAMDAGTPSALNALLDSLRPGKSEEGGQDRLIQAIQAWWRARGLPAGRERAQQILLGNALIGFHEQVRLQEAIEGGLALPLPRRAQGRRARALSTLWRETATGWLMRFELPEEALRLGRDLPPLPDGASFPADLRALTCPELRRVVNELDRTPDTLRGSGADDWASLEDRMNFILDLFRSRQQSGGLLSPPYSPLQVAAFEAGRLPEGPL